MTDSAQHPWHTTDRQPVPDKPVVDSQLFRTAGWNPRHEGESWLHWKFREAFARP